MVTQNILHNFRGYTYNITLKSLSIEEYNNAYRRGFNMQNGVVLKSSGKGGKNNSKPVSGATNLDDPCSMIFTQNNLMFLVLDHSWKQPDLGA